MTEALPAQVHEDATFFATDGSTADKFGASVSVCGDRALVGATYEDHAGFDDVGAAYVFERDATGTWNQVAKLRSSDGTAGDKIGWSVCLTADRAFVGAPYEDEYGTQAGAVYLFDRQANGSWVQVAKIVADDPQTFADFGVSVSAFGDRVLVGASRVIPSGAAYLYERDPVSESWNQIAKLTGSDVSDDARFGYAVSLVGNRALVGCPWDDPRGLNLAGSAFVFEADSGGNWLQVAKLVASDVDTWDIFGAALELFGDRALIGSPFDDELGTNTGSAYVFDREGGTWHEVAKLRAGDAAAEDQLGGAARLFGDRALIGAPGDDGVGPNHGSAYVFERGTSGAWTEVAELHPSDSLQSHKVGNALSLSGDRTVAGDTSADGAVLRTGAGHVFDIGIGETYCHSTANSTGSAAMLAAVGSNSVAANELSLTAAPVPKVASGIFFLGPTQVNEAFGNGIRCAGGSIVRLAPTIARHHVLSQRLDLTAPPLSGAIVPGSSWNFQAWFRDVPAGGAYFNTSSAISILFEL